MAGVARKARDIADEAKMASGDFTRVAIDSDRLKQSLQYDNVAFISLFLYDQDGIERGVPEFHDWTFAMMNNMENSRVAIALPRDHAKTTLAKLSAVHHWIYSKIKFVIYISNTSSVAADACKDIANFVRSPMAKAIWGEAIFTQAEESKGNYTFFWCGKTCILRAFGAGQQVRGKNIDNQRPDLAIVDDLESAEQGEENKLGYAGLKTWFYATFMKSLDKRYNKVIQIGNHVKTKSILADHLASPTWKSVCLGAITSKGQPLWPARWTVEGLSEDLLEYIREGQMYVWFAEMLNMPITQSTKLLDVKGVAITAPVLPSDPRILLRCITVDPAISKNMDYAHAATVCVHVYLADEGEPGERDDISGTSHGYWQLADSSEQYGVSPYELYDTIEGLTLKWGVQVVGIENEGYQTALIYVCEHQAAQNDAMTAKFVPLDTFKQPKTTRLKAWIGMIKKGLYRFSINDYALFQQIQEYNVTSKKNDDDLIDCAAYIVQMISRYSTQMAHIQQGDPPTGGELPPPTIHTQGA